MPLRKLTRHELFIADIKKRMKELELLIRNYEASLPVDEDPHPVDAVFRDPDTGEVLWRAN